MHVYVFTSKVRLRRVPVGRGAFPERTNALSTTNLAWYEKGVYVCLFDR